MRLVVAFLVAGSVAWGSLVLAPVASACDDIAQGCSTVCQSADYGDTVSSACQTGNGQAHKVYYAGMTIVASVTKGGDHSGEDGATPVHLGVQEMAAVADNEPGLSTGQAGKVYFRIEWRIPLANRTATDLSFTVTGDSQLVFTKSAATVHMDPASGTKVEYFPFTVAPIAPNSKSTALFTIGAPLKPRLGVVTGTLQIPVKQTYYAPLLGLPPLGLAGLVCVAGAAAGYFGGRKHTQFRLNKGKGPDDTKSAASMWSPAPAC